MTPQQTLVLSMHAQGKNDREIAAELWLSVDTIRYHKKNAFRFLRVHSLEHAIIRARTLGYIDDAGLVVGRCSTCLRRFQ